MTIFDSKSLHDAVATSLADAGIPEDHKNAFAVIATTAGVKGVLTTKINDVWEVDTVFSVNSQKHVEGGVQVKATW
jgi:hypothetical protein